MKNRVLVTGAHGFLGSATVRALKARGWEVVGISTASGDGTYRRTDLLDVAAVRALVNDVMPTHLVHAAWMSLEHGNVMRSPQNIDWLRASLFLVQAFREAGGERAALIGTSAEYDWTQGICRNNVTPMRPATIYGACKHALRIALEAYAQVTGLGFVWPRVFFVYGPGQQERFLAASVIRSLLRGEPAECTLGFQVRDYLHVDDVASGIVAALESTHAGAVDIARGEGVQVRDLVLQIARELDREDLVRFGARPTPHDDAPVVVGDAGEAGALLGWAPRFSLASGVADTVAWGRTAFASP